MAEIINKFNINIMKAFLKENTWTPQGLGGWGNGYVALPRRHPYFGLGYGEINKKLEHHAHVNLTFSKNSDDIIGWEEVADMEDMWVVGWDTVWFGTENIWTKERVLKENQILSIHLAKVWSDEIEKQSNEVESFIDKLRNSLI